MPRKFYWESPVGTFDTRVSRDELTNFMCACRNELNLHNISDQYPDFVDCSLTVSRDGLFTSTSKSRNPVIYEGCLRISNLSETREDKVEREELNISRTFKFIKNTAFHFKLRRIFNI